MKADVTSVVMEYLTNKGMLKAWNTTIVTLIPKIEHIEGVGEYKPIACCNTSYKVISKVLCNRLSLVLPNIMSRN